MPIQMMSSLLRGESHQHLTLVVLHHPTIISQWLPQSNNQHGQIGLGTLVFWYGDKSQDLSSLVVPEILNIEGEHG